MTHATSIHVSRRIFIPLYRPNSGAPKNIYIYIYMYIYIYIYIYIHTYNTCTEEATDMAAKYLHSKKRVFNNFGK